MRVKVFLMKFLYPIDEPIIKVFGILLKASFKQVVLEQGTVKHKEIFNKIDMLDEICTCQSIFT